MSTGTPGSMLLYLREDEVRHGAGLILCAARVLSDAGAEALASAGLRPAHHLPLMLIAHYPGLHLSALMSMLRVKKQSLQPILDDLARLGLIEIRSASADRRRRCLYPTDAGLDVERTAFAPLRHRLAAAYRKAGPQSVAGLRSVLESIVGDEPLQEPGS